MEKPPVMAGSYSSFPFSNTVPSTLMDTIRKKMERKPKTEAAADHSARPPGIHESWTDPRTLTADCFHWRMRTAFCVGQVSETVSCCYTHCQLLLHTLSAAATHTVSCCYTCCQLLLHTLSAAATHTVSCCYTHCQLLLHTLSAAATHAVSYCYTCCQLLIRLYSDPVSCTTPCQTVQ